MYHDRKALRFLGILSLFAFQAACHHTHVVNRKSPSSLAVLNEAAEARDGSLALRSGDRFEAENVQASFDSTRWTDLEDRVHAAATPDVAEVTYTDRGKGALQGLMIAGAIGAVVGGYLLGSLVAALCETDSCEVPEAVAVGALLGGAASGVVLGLPIGAVVGDRQTYEFLKPSETGH